MVLIIQWHLRDGYIPEMTNSKQGIVHLIIDYHYEIINVSRRAPRESCYISKETFCFSCCSYFFFNIVELCN